MLASELPSYGPKRSRSMVQRLGAWFDGVLPRRADHVIAVTPDIRNRLIEEHGIAADRVTVVTNGVEVERFKVPPPPADGAVRIIYSGTLAPYQDVDLLLEAFARAWRTRNDLRLVFSVSSTFRNYSAHVNRLGIRDAVEVLPDNFEVLPERLAGAAMAVLPRTRCDGIPQKLLNYMAAAKAIVSSAGSAKVIEHETHRPGDPERRCRKPSRARCCGSPPIPRTRRSWGSRRASTCRRHYSWEQAAERVEQVYDTVIAARGHAGRGPRRIESVAPVDSPK